jgi:hypothetical protein
MSAVAARFGAPPVQRPEQLRALYNSVKMYRDAKARFLQGCGLLDAAEAERLYKAFQRDASKARLVQYVDYSSGDAVLAQAPEGQLQALGVTRLPPGQAYGITPYVRNAPPEAAAAAKVYEYVFRTPTVWRPNKAGAKPKPADVAALRKFCEDEKNMRSFFAHDSFLPQDEVLSWTMSAAPDNAVLATVRTRHPQGPDDGLLEFESFLSGQYSDGWFESGAETPNGCFFIEEHTPVLV